MIKKTRFILQLFFFIGATWPFIGGTTNSTFHQFYKSLHFIPTLTYISWFIIPPFFVITIAITILPLIWGRIYCSFICPVGFIQDVVFKIKNIFFKQKKKRPYRFIFFSNTLSIFAIYLVLSRSGWQGMLDHFANFIRVLSLKDLNFSLNFIISILFLSIIVVVPFFYPRFFCLILCPSGAIYRILNKFSLINITTSDKCNLCGFCEAECPTLCIKDGLIDKSSCITCFECLESCPQKGFKIKFQRPFKKKDLEIKEQNNKRRTFLKAILTIGIGTAFGQGINWATRLIKNTTKLVVPPGAKSVSQFYSSCIGCNQCISVCPTKVLKSGSKENGPLGYTKPYLDYTSSYCSYECNACQSVCPTNALNYTTLEKKQMIKIGESQIDESKCIPYTHKRICGSCSEHCPSGAIKMVDVDGVLAPKVSKEYCIGCGICEKVCPTKPKSILVNPLAIHTMAYSSRKNSTGNPIMDKSDFPF